jgi:predicted DNA-binding protein
MKKHYPPSRARYDQSHPTISIRVKRELYNELKELQERTGKTLGDILREAAGKQKLSAKGSYQLGYNAAKEKYSVLYKCNICHDLMIVTSDDEKKAIASYTLEHGWRHGECHKT